MIILISPKGKQTSTRVGLVLYFSLLNNPNQVKKSFKLTGNLKNEVFLDDLSTINNQLRGKLSINN